MLLQTLPEKVVRHPASRVMVQQCLARRIGDKKTLTSEITKWERRRNAESARIRWMFTVDRAREKLGRAYPVPAYPLYRAAA